MSIDASSNDRVSLISDHKRNKLSVKDDSLSSCIVQLNIAVSSSTKGDSGVLLMLKLSLFSPTSSCVHQQKRENVPLRVRHGFHVNFKSVEFELREHISHSSAECTPTSHDVAV